MRSPIKPVLCEHGVMPLQSCKFTSPLSWVCIVNVVFCMFFCMNSNDYELSSRKTSCFPPINKQVSLHQNECSPISSQLSILLTKVFAVCCSMKQRVIFSSTYLSVNKKVIHSITDSIIFTMFGYSLLQSNVM